MQKQWNIKEQSSKKYERTCMQGLVPSPKLARDEALTYQNSPGCSAGLSARNGHNIKAMTDIFRHDPRTQSKSL